jgi:hypothetical protein
MTSHQPALQMVAERSPKLCILEAEIKIGDEPPEL